VTSTVEGVPGGLPQHLQAFRGGGQLHLRLQAAALQHALEAHHQLLRVEGLDHVVPGAQLHGLHRVADLAVGGDHDHRHAQPLLAQPREQGQAVQARHAQVDDRRGEGLLGQQALG
jgi:hypothetical protein